MKILLVRGNPRVGGVCERIADIFASALKSSGADVFDFDISRSNILPCRGCFACTRSEKNACVINDDMTKVREFLSDADALVCVSPIYFYSMSSQMKMFFDRCFPFVCGYGFNSETGDIENSLAFRNKKKKFLTISVASGRLESSFAAISQTYRTISDAFGFEYCADIRRSQSPYFTSIGLNSIRVNRILSAFSEAGKSFAISGKIESDIIKRAEESLSQNDERFAEKSKIFWELSKIRKVGDTRVDELKSDIRSFISMIRKSDFLDESEKITIKFSFPDKATSFISSFSKTTFTLSKTASDSVFDAEFIFNSTLFQDILKGLISVNFAIESGSARLNGNSVLVDKLKKAFNFS